MSLSRRMRNEESKWNKKISLKGHAYIVYDREKREAIVSIYRRSLRNVIFFKLRLTGEYPFSPPKAEISLDLKKWKLLHEEFFKITEGSIKNWRKKWGKYHCPCCKSLLLLCGLTIGMFWLTVSLGSLVSIDSIDSLDS